MRNRVGRLSASTRSWDLAQVTIKSSVSLLLVRLVKVKETGEVLGKLLGDLNVIELSYLAECMCVCTVVFGTLTHSRALRARHFLPALWQAQVGVHW